MLMSCTAYREGGKIGDIDKKDISAYVSQPDCFVWVALKDPEPGELEEMQEEFGLHPLAVEDAQRGEQRPKVEEYGGDLFVVLTTLDVTADGIADGKVAIFVGKNYVLSVRHRTPVGFAAVRERCEREPELLAQGAGFVLYALLDAVVDRYFPVIESIETELERTEERIFSASPGRENVEALYCLKQKLTTVQHAVRPLLEALAKLFGGRVPPICLRSQDYYRDVYDHLARIQQSTESLRDMAASATSVHFSLISLQENETTKRLAAYAALIAVPTFIAGLYGMNFEHMPEVKWTFGYPAALVFMGLVDVFLFWRFRKTKWL